jgi:guanylate kinase
LKAVRAGHLFVVSGPSGSGKTTLIERFLKEDALSRFSISYTTRDKRLNEAHGKDYFFVDTETFEAMIREGRFLEWEMVHGSYYGTPRREVAEALEQGTDLFLDIDVKGAIKVREEFPDACLIFIEPPSRTELERRLAARGEKQINLRMKRVQEEIEKKPFFDYTVVNDNIDPAYRTFRDIVEAVRREKNGAHNR